MAVRTSTNKIDYLFFGLTVILVLVGLVILTSASAPAGYTEFGDTAYFIKKQLLFGLLPGVFLFYFCMKIKYQFWSRFSWVIYITALALLILVFVPGVGLMINGARSWIGILGYSFQPAEFAKLALVIAMANMLSESKRNLDDWKNGLLPVLAIIAPIIILIGLQPDIGTLSILAVMIFVILYLSGIRKAYLMILGLLGVVAFAALLLIAPYRVQRLTTFLHPELDPKGVGYQINQSFLAVGSGGLWGLGLGHSRQKFQYLPEVHADSIFAIMAEETGFIVCVFFVLAITFFGLRGLKIAKGAPDQFARLLVGGIVIWFMWQSFLNIGSMVGALPLTGVPLPFVSHGGSALIVALMAVGMVLNVSREARL
ncbi:MAG: putative lipid II flippase FtsW [bacterium]